MITVFSDCHWFSNDPIDVDPELGESVFYIGDNFEFKNIPKDSVNDRVIEVEKFLDIAKATKTKVLFGNHEVSMCNNIGNYKCIYNNTLFIHGHRELWEQDRVDKWENRKLGQSYVFRMFSYALSRTRKRVFRKKKQSEKELDSMYMAAIHNNCDMVIYGHTHPKEMLVKKHKGVLCVNVPQGKTNLDLDFLRRRYDL